jgi:hypothetical protein
MTRREGRRPGGEGGARGRPPRPAAVGGWLIPDGLSAVPAARSAVPELRSGFTYTGSRGDCPQAPGSRFPDVVNVSIVRAASAA